MLGEGSAVPAFMTVVYLDECWKIGVAWLDGDTWCVLTVLLERFSLCADV